MAKTTIYFSVVFITLGIIAYIFSNFESVTALIPTFFGILLLVTGLLAQKESLRKHAMHAAAILGVLGFGGTVSGLIKLPSLLGNEEVARPVAIVVQSIMAILCIIFVALCIKSFIDARKNRQS